MTDSNTELIARETEISAFWDGDEFYRYLYVICRGFFIAETVGQAERIEDAVQDSLAKAWLHRSSFRPSGKEGQLRNDFRKWIAQIARNHCLDVLRRRREMLTDDLSLREKGADPMGAVRDNLDLLRCLRRLSAANPPFYEALVLRYLCDTTLAETAAVLSITSSVARTRVDNAVKMLRSCLGGSDFLEGRGL